MRTDTSSKPRVAAGRGPLPFRALVVAVDLSAGADRVIRRACLLPLAAGARVVLLHVVAKSLPERLRATAAADARRMLEELAEVAGRRLGPDASVECVVRSGSAAREIGQVAAEAGAQLLVLGRGDTEKFRELFLGSTAERVLRSARLPVLVVRLPAREAYQRPLLAADAEAPLHGVLATLFRVVPEPRPPMAWVHAFDTPLRGLIYPSLTPAQSADYDAQFERRARVELEQRVAASRARVSPLDRAKWRAMVLPGSPRRVIPDAVAALRADLLAMGSHARSGLEHALLGTVAGDVLREVTCDVLVVPPKRR